MTERDRYEAALQEYKELEANIRHSTENSMKTKNWSITIGLAAIIAALTQKQPVILLLSPIAALLFLAMDARWRAYMVCFIERQKEIERYFLGEVNQYIGPQINRSFERNLNRMKKNLTAWSIARNSSIHIPHSLVIFVALSTYTLTSWGIIVFPQ